MPVLTTYSGPRHLGWIWPAAEQATVVAQRTAPDGTIYVADDVGNLTALHPSGKVLWELPNTGSPAGSLRDILLSPDGRQIYLIFSQRITAISSEGAQLWYFKRLNEWIRSGPYLAPDGSLYVQTYYIDAEAGREIGYRISPDGQVHSFSWPESFNVRDVGFDSQSRLHLVDPGSAILMLDSTGKVLQTCVQSAYLNSKPTVSREGVTYYVTRSGEVIAQQEDCTVLWQATIQENEMDHSQASSPILLSDKTLYIGGAGRIYAFDAQSGQLRWRSPQTTQDDWIYHMAISPDGQLYALGRRAIWLAFDARGRLTWKQSMYDAGAPGLFSLAPNGDLIAERGGHLQVYTADPEQVFVVPTPVPSPANRAQAEAEIVEFMLNTIVQGEMGFRGEFVRRTGKMPDEQATQARDFRWLNWKAVTTEQKDTRDYEFAETIQTWWYTNGELVDLTAPAPTADEHVQRGIYHNFGIVTVSNDHQRAEVYYSFNLCNRNWCDGSGYLYRLERSPSGQWWLVEIELLWMA